MSPTKLGFNRDSLFVRVSRMQKVCCVSGWTGLPVHIHYFDRSLLEKTPPKDEGDVLYICIYIYIYIMYLKHMYVS